MNTFIPKSKLYVITKSGIDLGKVSSVEVDVASGRITSFFVASSHMIPRLLESELIISWHQVIDWDQDKIIVDDMVVPAEAKNIALNQASSKKAGAHFKEV